VYNLLGQKIAVLVNDFKQAGVYTYKLDASSLRSMASGMYIYRLQVGSQVICKKMILMK
jgi:hypothetical protein